MQLVIHFWNRNYENDWQWQQMVYSIMPCEPNLDAVETFLKENFPSFTNTNLILKYTAGVHHHQGVKNHKIVTKTLKLEHDYIDFVCKGPYSISAKIVRDSKPIPEYKMKRWYFGE